MSQGIGSSSRFGRQADDLWSDDNDREPDSEATVEIARKEDYDGFLTGKAGGKHSSGCVGRVVAP